MPELPEAETIARALHDQLADRRLGTVTLLRSDIVHGDPRPLSDLLPSRRVKRVWRRAKRVMLDLDPAAELIFHLGMSGRLTVTACDDPLEKHTHLRIQIRQTDQELRFRDPRRFGGIWCFCGNGPRVGRALGPVGLEPFEATPAQWRSILDRRRTIKALLLDQRLIAGLGNIYCDESLHTAGIHPLAPANVLDKKGAARLLRSVRSTLNRAIRSGGSTLMDYRQADGSSGSFQKRHRVYGREGKPCKTCDCPIERLVVAGRSSYLCPRCQPIPVG